MPTNKHDSIVEPIILAATRMEAIANRYIFEPMGLTVASAKVLKMLARSPQGVLTPTELVHATGGTKSNISQRITFLEKKGLLQRTAGTGFDRRQVAVQLTRAGKAKVIEIKKRAEQPSANLAKCFTAKEIAAQLAFFQKLDQVLNRCEKDLKTCFKA